MADHFKGAKVITLSAKDFDSSMKLKKKPGKNTLIVFHANWCGFCLQLAPVYKQLSSKTKVYSIEADLPGSSEIFQHYQIQGFPSIRYMDKNGKIDTENYYGERDVASMIKYIKEKSTSGGAKRKAAKKPAKKQVKKCVGKGCKGKCSGKCKKQKGGCSGGKCSGACKGGACKAHKGGAKKKRGRGRPKDTTMKKIKKKVQKSLKKVKKMLGGKKKKVAKKTINKRKPARKTIKKRGKK